jgi:hypothetical protein
MGPILIAARSGFMRVCSSGSPSDFDLAPAHGGRRRSAPGVLLPLMAILLWPLVIGGRALAEDDADAPLPLPQLKAPSQPQPNRTEPLKTSRRMPLSEPLPPVERPSAPIPLQAAAPGTNFSVQPVAGTANFNQPPGAPDQIPMPLIRPQQVTVPGGLRPLSDITVDIAPSKGPLPKDRSDVLVVGTTSPMFYARTANIVRYQWEAPVVAHGPLYFQDVPLEHFGQSCCPYLQPAISAAKFLGNVLILPYRATLDPPCRETYNLRTYPRPGTPVPCLRETLPLRLKPLLVEMGVVTAIVLVIP